MKRILLRALLSLSVVGLAAAQVGTPFCQGTGCPCANDDPTAGCGNAGHDDERATGSRLEGAGSADVFADDLVLTATGIAPGQVGVFLMGAATAGTVAGDGLLCVGAGAGGLWRFPPQAANNSGAMSLMSVVSASQAFGQGAISAGSTWSFQTWYRDPGGPCGAGSNVSNGLTITFEAAGTHAPVATELAGEPLAAYPHFEFVRNFNEGTDLHVAIDPTRMPWLVGTTGDLYVVDAKDVTGWELDPALLDARGGPQAWTIVAGGVQANTLLADAGGLQGTLGDQVGVGYDVVFDADRDGLLGPGDVIDGFSERAGAYVVRDTVAPGPYPVIEALYNGGNWLQQDIYFPFDVANMGALPLVVVSHGNGHNYQWYDHIGFHLASYGYVVMSHSNNTAPGIETASETTLNNTDHFLGNLDVIAGGVLDGHVDGARIVWIGHSRGGEGIVRAYDRLFEGQYVPLNYTIDDLQLLSSIAPTVFFKKNKSHPHKANYHLWVGSADNDVTGGPASPVGQSFTLLERGNGAKAAIVLQGMGHAVFHGGGGGFVANGPCLNNRVRTHKLMKGYLLPLCEYFLEGDDASKDFLWRQYEAYQPIGKPGNGDGCVVVTYELHESSNDLFIVDDFQKEPGDTLSSSGQAVRWTVRDLFEGKLSDHGTLTYNPLEPMNGMTRASYPLDDPAGLVFTWDQPSFLEFDLHPDQRNLTDDAYLSFRACQGTRHPATQAALEDLTFQVSLVDELGGASTIGIGAYGGGIEEPYQRSGQGTGVGWSNEFETVRLRLTDFLADGGAVNLAIVETIRFEFGAPPWSPVGRLGLDDVVIVKEDE